MRTRFLWWSSALLVVAGACASDKWRQATYPPSFHYTSNTETRAVMDRLAGDVSSLDKLLRSTPLPDADQQTEVVRLLTDIERNAGKLRGSGQQTNHPLVDANLDGFLRDVEAAKRAAQAQPANYFLAGSITGACMGCHEHLRK